MEIRSMSMDVLAADGGKYNVRVGTDVVTGFLEFSLWSGHSTGVQTHVYGCSVGSFVRDLETRRKFSREANVLFEVDVYGIIRAWVRVIEDIAK